MTIGSDAEPSDSKRSLRLLPESLLVQTGPVDHARWNYRGVLGAIQRKRFELGRGLIGDRRYEALLEIGYGSGIFMAELAGHARRLLGLDVHDKTQEVARALREVGVEADLRQGCATALPFESGSIGCVIAISALEFIDDLDKACEEVRRVLEPEGHFIVVTPGSSPILDAGLKLLTGKSAKEDFGNRRERIVPTLERSFKLLERVRYPPVRILGSHLYTALKLGKT